MTRAYSLPLSVLASFLATATAVAADPAPLGTASPPSPCAPGAGGFDFEASTQGAWAESYAARAFGPPAVDSTQALCGRSSIRMSAHFSATGRRMQTNHLANEEGELEIKPGGLPDFTDMTVEAGILVDGPPDVRPIAYIMLVSDGRWMPGRFTTVIPGQWTMLRQQYGEENSLGPAGGTGSVHHVFKIVVALECVGCRAWDGQAYVDAIRWYHARTGNRPPVASSAVVAQPPKAPVPASPPPAGPSPQTGLVVAVEVSPPRPVAQPSTIPASSEASSEAPAVVASSPPRSPPANESEASIPLTLALIAGSSIPINGLNYYSGIGARGGVNLGRFYLGGLFAVHRGASFHISQYGNDALGVPAGVQNYNSLPFVFGIDGGYEVPIRIGALATTLTPFLSLGLIVIHMESDGVYGNWGTTQYYPVVGAGLAYSVSLGPHYAIGLEGRFYNQGDTSFHFGNLSQGTYEHGFSTSIFYSAIYGDVSYRW